MDPLIIRSFKVAAENILKIYAKRMVYNIAVPHNIIGPKQKYDDPYRNVVSGQPNASK